jgi:hypothetical protein
MKSEVAIKLNQTKINKNNSTKFGVLLMKCSEFNSNNFYTLLLFITDKFTCVYIYMQCLYVISAEAKFKMPR